MGIYRIDKDEIPEFVTANSYLEARQIASDEICVVAVTDDGIDIPNNDID